MRKHLDRILACTKQVEVAGCTSDGRAGVDAWLLALALLWAGRGCIGSRCLSMGRPNDLCGYRVVQHVPRNRRICCTRLIWTRPRLARGISTVRCALLNLRDAMAAQELADGQCLCPRSRPLYTFFLSLPLFSTPRFRFLALRIKTSTGPSCARRIP